jgi:hypothetical protein
MGEATSPLAVGNRQALDALDIANRCADRSISGMGYPGF